MSCTDYVTIDYDAVEHSTTNAILFTITEEDENTPAFMCWIPKSQMRDHDVQARTFEIPEWLAEEKGLI